MQRNQANYDAPRRLKERIGLAQLVGESPVFRNQIEKIPLLASCSATVLITGETGTGKGICARVIHYLGPRAEQPFVAVNCGAIPAELAENELFGHEAGAFTSATASQSGLLVEADGGSLFLDEVEGLPLAAQVKLLRFLEDKECRPLGGGETRHLEVRVIAASNVVLEEAIRAGRFRQDLYYRLEVLSLCLPPLRERREDIPLLARHFLSKYAAESGRPVQEISDAALRQLLTRQWPGNVRELENVIQRVVLLNPSPRIEASDLSLPASGVERPGASFRALKAKVIEEFEQGYLTEMLRLHGGNISAAATAAQKDRRAFWELLRKHHLLAPHDRPPCSH